jgi:hypothetical protein
LGHPSYPIDTQESTYLSADSQDANYELLTPTTLQVAARLLYLFRQPCRDFKLFKNFAAPFPENNQ